MSCCSTGALLSLTAQSRGDQTSPETAELGRLLGLGLGFGSGLGVGVGLGLGLGLRLGLGLGLGLGFRVRISPRRPSWVAC